MAAEQEPKDSQFDPSNNFFANLTESEASKTPFTWYPWLGAKFASWVRDKIGKTQNQ